MRQQRIHIYYPANDEDRANPVDSCPVLIRLRVRQKLKKVAAELPLVNLLQT
jgi:hypothetical protein